MRALSLEKCSSFSLCTSLLFCLLAYREGNANNRTDSHMSTAFAVCGTWQADRKEENQRDKEWCNILEALQIDLQWLMNPRKMCSVLETACKAEKLLSIWKQLTGLTMSITPDLGQGYHPLCQPKWRDIHSYWNRKMAKNNWTQKKLKKVKGRSRGNFGRAEKSPWVMLQFLWKL